MSTSISLTRPWCWLDAFVSTEIRIGHRSHCAFRTCGCAGLAVAVAVVMLLTVHQELSVRISVGIVTIALATFVGLALLTKFALGQERLVYYHHEIAIVFVVTAMLWLLGQPALPYLDTTILGIGALLAVGRIGCFMVGCCHGRPHRFGVCYRPEHAHAGFTRYYVGVRLFPIQLVESVYVAGVVTVGVAIVWGQQPAGTALAWYTISYGAGRCFFEFMRGDPSRGYWRGFSEAQWTSMLLVFAVARLEMAGTLPYHTAHLEAAALLATVMAGIGVARRWGTTAEGRLLNPRHVREIAHAARLADGGETTVVPGMLEKPAFGRRPIQCTSAGIRISTSLLTDGPTHVRHYAMSCRHDNMTDDVARTVAGVIVTIESNFSSKELLHGTKGVYHLLLRRPSA